MKKTSRRCSVVLVLIAVCPLVFEGNVLAQGWSVTEAHYQGGSALRPHPVSPTGFQNILTLQHASGWSHGENFFFVDMICCSGSSADRDIHMEWYPYFDLGSITGQKLSWGRIRGIGPLGG